MPDEALMHQPGQLPGAVARQRGVYALRQRRQLAPRRAVFSQHPLEQVTQAHGFVVDLRPAALRAGLEGLSVSRQR